MKKRLLAVFAHPDDEAFGPGGTIAKYADEGVLIHLLCATRGEGGQYQVSGNRQQKTEKKEKIEDIREQELIKSAEVLGIKKVEFLDFIDGKLSNSNYHELAEKIINKINAFKPQVVLTDERLGISGHLDHIAVSMVTTYSFLKTREAVKLYYYCLSKSQRNEERDDYFVYFPEGYSQDQITTKIDYSNYYDIKKKAMKKHESQMEDVKSILVYLDKIPKIENFILQFNRLKTVKLPENDLFNGID